MKNGSRVYRLHFDALHAVACIAVAECQLRLQMTTKALALLASKMHMILQHCDCLSQAKAQLLIAKCKLQLHQGAASGMTKTELYEPLSHLDMAQKGFTKVNAIKELQQVHYLRARIHHHLKNFTYVVLVVVLVVVVVGFCASSWSCYSQTHSTTYAGSVIRRLKPSGG